MHVAGVLAACLAWAWACSPGACRRHNAATVCSSNCSIGQYFKRDLPGVVQRHSLGVNGTTPAGPGGGEGTVPQRPSPGVDGAANPTANPRLFSLVRSPWERVMSAFKSKFVGVCKGDPACFKQTYMANYGHATAGPRPFAGVKHLTVGGADCPRVDGVYTAERQYFSLQRGETISLFEFYVVRIRIRKKLIKPPNVVPSSLPLAFVEGTPCNLV